MDNTL